MNRKYLGITIFVWMVFFGILLAQTQPATQWERTYGGPEWDVGTSVQQTTDGGYIIVGSTRSFGAGGSDVYLIKTHANGDIEWTMTHGGPQDDHGSSVQQTTDGGYIIAGWTSSFGAGSFDVWLIKTDEWGVRIWRETYGGSGHDRGFSVQQTTDGGYIIVGETYSFGAGGGDVLLIKFNADGEFLWRQTYGGTGYDCGKSVQQTTDGGYIIAGYTNSFGTGSFDVWLIKTDANGVRVWDRTYGGLYWDYGYSVRQTTDGGYIIAGATYTFGPGTPDYSNVYLIKTDRDGRICWKNIYGGGGHDCGYSVQQSIDGGYIIAGFTASFGAGDWDVWLIRTDVNGVRLWDRTYGGA